MSSEYLPAFTRCFEAFNRRDLDGWLEMFCDDGELLDGLTLNPEPYRGRDELTRWFRAWDKAWSEIEISELSVVHEAGDSIVIRWKVAARGRTSGAAITQWFYAACAMREGRIQRLEAYTTEADALRASATLA
jgi:ketosteroid isomerase-like protein